MTIKVFVGCSSGDDLESQAVLEYSIRKTCSQDVDICWMQVSRNPLSPFYGWRTRYWNTPFTGFRWAIPELCDFTGRAIYMDSDMIVRADLTELWEWHIPPGAFILAKGSGPKLRACVMLMDCEAARKYLPSISSQKIAYDSHGLIMKWLRYNSEYYAQLPSLWNCVDLKGVADINDSDIKIIHYSSIAHQPSTPHALARLAKRGFKHWYDGEIFDHWRPELTQLFDRMLEEAIAAGYTLDKYEPETRVSPMIRSYKSRPVKGFSL